MNRYFDNHTLAVSAQHGRRQSLTAELSNFFKGRPDIAHVLAKGLMKAEFVEYDAIDAQQRAIESRQDIKAKLTRKLHKKRRPTMDELELRGIVPQGYVVLFVSVVRLTQEWFRLEPL